MQPRMLRRPPVSSPRLRAFAGESWVHFSLEQLWPLSCTEECVVLDIRWQVRRDTASTGKTRSSSRRRIMATAQGALRRSPSAAFDRLLCAGALCSKTPIVFCQPLVINTSCSSLCALQRPLASARMVC